MIKNKPLPHSSLPLLGFCAWSGTGKTTLLTKLIPLLAEKKLRVAVIKHAHHHFDIDHPGKDSYQLREAGAKQILVTSRKRMAWIKEISEVRDEPSLSDALNVLDTDELDLILVEGFKHEAFAKIELHRTDLNKPFMFPDDADIIAIATDKPTDIEMPQPNTLKVIDLNQPAAIVTFILNDIL